MVMVARVVMVRAVLMMMVVMVVVVMPVTLGRCLWRAKTTVASFEICKAWQVFGRNQVRCSEAGVVSCVVGRRR